MMPDIVVIATQLKLATREHLLVAPGMLRHGQPYYLYSKKRNAFEGIYVIDKYTSHMEIEAWFNANMVYVPVDVLENDITIVPEEFIEYHQILKVG